MRIKLPFYRRYRRFIIEENTKKQDQPRDSTLTLLEIIEMSSTAEVIEIYWIYNLVYQFQDRRDSSQTGWRESHRWFSNRRQIHRQRCPPRKGQAQQLWAPDLLGWQRKTGCRMVLHSIRLQGVVLQRTRDRQPGDLLTCCQAERRHFWVSIGASTRKWEVWKVFGDTCWWC